MQYHMLCIYTQWLPRAKHPMDPNLCNSSFEHKLPLLRCSCLTFLRGVQPYQSALIHLDGPYDTEYALHYAQRCGHMLCIRMKVNSCSM